MVAPVGRNKKNNHIHTRASEHFTFAAGKLFTLQRNASRRLPSALHIPYPPLSKKAGYFAAPLVRHSLVRRRIVAALIVDFSSFALNEFLFFLPRFFEKLYEFRPDFRIGYFVTCGVMIDKISPVVSCHPNLTFFRDTA